MLTAMYIPQWDRAVEQMPLQFLLIGVLWAAMFAYARRWGARPAAIGITSGVVAPGAVLLIAVAIFGSGEHGDFCRRWSDSDHDDVFFALVEYFELWGFAISAFFGMIFALFFIPVAATWHDRDAPDDAEAGSETKHEAG